MTLEWQLLCGARRPRARACADQSRPRSSGVPARRLDHFRLSLEWLQIFGKRMSKSYTLYGLILLTFSVALGAKPASEPFPILVDTSWLATRLQESGSVLLVLDVREPPLYAEGHIPGAVNLPVERTFGGVHNDRLGSLRDLRELFSATGLRNTDHIVIYDDGMIKDAARMFWVLQTYGHTRVSLLDGGLRAWRGESRGVTREPAHRPRSNYVPSIQPRHLATKLATRLSIYHRNVKILDARSEDEFLGLKSKARRYGHIPSAINVPWEKNFSEQAGVRRLLIEEDLQRLYAGFKGHRVIAYCNRGKESALSYFVLRKMGFEISVYDGSWLEWGNDEQLPIELGFERNQ